MADKINQLVEQYRNGTLNRREFMKKLAIVAGGTVLVTLLPGHHTALAASGKVPGSRLLNKFITYPGGTGEIRAYMSVLKGRKKRPAVIIIHENRGLVPHIQDVTRRMAAEGFLAMAPDALSPLGGTPEDENQGRTMIGQLNRETTVKNFVAAVKYLKTHPRSTGKVGCTGFCWGGAMTNQVAVSCDELDAAVPYYGSTPSLDDVPQIKAPIMAHYAGNDERINAGIPAFEEALKKAGIEYHIFIYEGASHAFNNDTSERYNKEAAELAWSRTVAFFKEKLKK